MKPKRHLTLPILWTIYLNLVVCFPLSASSGSILPSDILEAENSALGDPLNDDDILERFIVDETDRLVGPDSADKCNLGLSVDSQLDDLAASVASVAGRGNRATLYQYSLAKAINMAELGKPLKSGHRNDEEFISKGIFDVLRESKPTVVHSRSLNARAERELIQYLWYTNKKLRPSEKALVLSMFDEANLPDNQRQIISEAWHEEALTKLGGPRLKRLVLHDAPLAGKVAVAVADQLYLSPSFLEYLPVVGVGITALKRIGKFPYEIINKIRSLKHHIEVIHRMPGNDLEMKIKAAVWTPEGRAMLSAAGLQALRWLAIKLIDRFKHVSFGKKEVDEIVQRCAYYILMHFAMKLTQCRFGE